jgi:hypothetical protein
VSETTSDSADPFVLYAARHRRPSRVFKTEPAPVFKPGQLEQKMEDNSVLTRRWRRWIRAEVREHLATPYPRQFTELHRLLRRLTIADGEHLVAYVRAADWLHAAPIATRIVAQRIIAMRIMQIRIRAGFAEIDDSLPFSDEPQTAYEQIRDLLRVFGRTS